MQLELVSEGEMATKSKKEKATDTKRSDIQIVHKHIIENEDDKKEKKKEKEERSSPHTPVGVPTHTPVDTPTISVGIIKRMYFPEDAYSRNQVAFKKILAAHGLSWIRGMMKTYTNKTGKQLLTGMYSTGDGSKKVFAIYEGTNKPATMLVKIMGTGGKFLLDLNSFCHKIGCVLEDKDSTFIDKTLLILQESNEIYIEKKMENVTLEDIQKKLEEKIEVRINEAIEKFIESYRFYYDNRCESLLWRKGFYDMNFIRRIRRLEIQENARWAVEHGF